MTKNLSVIFLMVLSSTVLANVQQSNSGCPNTLRKEINLNVGDTFSVTDHKYANGPIYISVKCSYEGGSFNSGRNTLSYSIQPGDFQVQ